MTNRQPAGNPVQVTLWIWEDSTSVRGQQLGEPHNVLPDTHAFQETGNRKQTAILGGAPAGHGRVEVTFMARDVDEGSPESTSPEMETCHRCRSGCRRRQHAHRQMKIRTHEHFFPFCMPSIPRIQTTHMKYIHAHMYTYTHAYHSVCIRSLTCVSTQVFARKQTNAYTQIHASVHAYITTLTQRNTIGRRGESTLETGHPETPQPDSKPVRHSPGAGSPAPQRC